MKKKKRGGSAPPFYQEGGIHINPEHEGDFTAFAQSMGMSVQEAARHVLANKDKYSSARVKQANFARNAAGWRQMGGESLVGSLQSGVYSRESGVGTQLSAFGGQQGAGGMMAFLQLGGDADRIKAQLMAIYGSDWERKATPQDLQRYNAARQQTSDALYSTIQEYKNKQLEDSLALERQKKAAVQQQIKDVKTRDSLPQSVDKLTSNERQKQWIEDQMKKMEWALGAGVSNEELEQRVKSQLQRNPKAAQELQQQIADVKKRNSLQRPVDNLAPNAQQQQWIEEQLKKKGWVPEAAVPDEDRQQQEAVLRSRDARKEAELARRARAIEMADEVKKIDFFSSDKWTRQNLARAAQGLGERFRLFPDDVDNTFSWLDDHLNPLMQLGKWAKRMGEAPLQAQRTNSVIPYLTAVGEPLLYRALESRPFEAAVPFLRKTLAARSLNDHLQNLWRYGVVDTAKDLGLDWTVDTTQAQIDKSLEPTGQGATSTYAFGGVSTEGYKADSPDRFNAFNVIPSNQITMQNVPHPVMGVDNLGNQQVMLPGVDYVFPGQAVLEVPMGSQESGVYSRESGVYSRESGVRSRESGVRSRESQRGGRKGGVLSQRLRTAGYQQGGQADETKTQTGPVDETTAQINFMKSLADSEMTTKRLQGELHKEDVLAEKGARRQSLEDADVRYYKDLPSWILGAYVPRQYKGMIFQDQAWKPAGLISDPIYGVDKPGTVYLSRQFMPGNVPAAKDATTPAHEVAHSALDGDAYITEYATQLVHDATNQGDDPDRTQLYGKKFGYSNEPSEMIARMQAIRYLLNKQNIYDARTQRFDDTAYEKMMKDPMIQGNSDFQDFYKVLKGNDAEKKQWFMRLMNEIASRSNGNGSTVARYGGPVRYQDGGETEYQPPQGYQPSSPRERANWNQFLDYLESKGVAGSKDLDLRDKNLGLQYLNEYNKANPNFVVPESFIPKVQYESYLIRRQNNFPGLSPEEAQTAFSNLSPAFRQRPISGIDNWLGSYTSKQYYPTFRRGKALHKSDGTEQVNSYDFGVNFEDYLRSRNDPNLEKKYIIQPSSITSRKTGGPYNSYYRQLGGSDDNGLYPNGVINPFDVDPSTFTKGISGAAAAPAAPAPAAAPATPAMTDTGLYPYGVINPFDRDPYSMQTNVAPKPTGASIPMSGFASKFNSPITIKEPSFTFNNKPPANTASTTTQNQPPAKKSWKDLIPKGVDLASTLIGGMSVLNTILESKDRNRYKNQVRIRSLGDASGPVVPGNLDNLRGDYAVNEGYFRPNRYTPVQFGSVPTAQLGGGYYDEPTELLPTKDGPKPTIQTTDPYANTGRGTGRGASTDMPDIKPNTRVRPNEAAWQAYDYYVHQKGLAPHVAAGIIGNLYQESGMNPTVHERARPEMEKKGYVAKGVGLGQWSVDGRYKDLLAYAEKNRRDPNDLYTQLDFVLEEPGEGLKALKALANARTPEEASYVFGKVYERPSDKYAGWDVRAGIARQLFEGTLPDKRDMAKRRGRQAGSSYGSLAGTPTNGGGLPALPGAAKFGGTLGYQVGGEYMVTPKQLEFILANGGEVEMIPPVPLKGRLRS